MYRTRACFSVAFAVFSLLCITRVAEGNIITTWDFSTGTLAGWQSTGDVIATKYSVMHDDYKDTLNLGVWNDRMRGDFALIRSNPGYLSTSVAMVPNAIPYSLSLDYAVAWSYNPANTTDPHPYGYFYVETDGMTSDGQLHHLSYKEIDWVVPSVSVTSKDVFTGSLFTENFSLLQWPDSVYKEFFISITVINPNNSLDQIVAIDNVTLSAVPTPVPSPLVPFGIGLAGIIMFRLKFKRS